MDVGYAQIFPVIEIFGPTLQGEGTQIGTMTYFVRLGGCDYRCSWCDTGYAVDPQQVSKEASLYTEETIVTTLAELDKDLGLQRVVLSGGNPCIHQNLSKLFLLLRGWYISVETQGTVIPKWIEEPQEFSISPKPPSSGNVTSWETLREFLRHLSSQTVYTIKIVVGGHADLEYALGIFRHVLKSAERKEFRAPESLVLQPLTQEPEGLIDDTLDLFEDVLETLRRQASPLRCPIRVIPQMHVLLWGKRRGV